MKIFVFLVFFVAICEGQQNSSHIVHGLFVSRNTSSPLIHYGTYAIDNKQFTLINSLHVDQVGDITRREFNPLTYDPNTDVVYIVGLSKQNHSLLSVINATTGVLLKTFNPFENEIFSLQYDIFQKQLFAQMDTGREMELQVIEIDTSTGKIKRVLATIPQASPSQVSSYCPICRKYFFMIRDRDNFTYVGVDSTDAGGVSWRTPIDVRPSSIHFDYKTFTMYIAFTNKTERARFQLGMLNRTIGTVGNIIYTFDERHIPTPVSAFDIAEKLYYSFILSFQPLDFEASYVNVNTGAGQQVQVPRETPVAIGWFVKQFVQ